MRIDAQFFRELQQALRAVDPDIGFEIRQVAERVAVGDVAPLAFPYLTDDEATKLRELGFQVEPEAASEGRRQLLSWGEAS